MTGASSGTSGASGSLSLEMEGRALNGRSELVVRLRSVFCFSSISETVTGFGARGGGGGSSGAAGLLLAPAAVEDAGRAVVFFAAEVVAAGFGEEERGVLVAIQSGMRGSEKKGEGFGKSLPGGNYARAPPDMASWAAA